jgi:type III secretory pathway lipoprotein EscJ
LAQLSLEKNELKEDSPSMISIRQSLQRNIDSYIPGIKALLPFSIEVIECQPSMCRRSTFVVKFVQWENE